MERYRHSMGTIFRHQCLSQRQSTDGIIPELSEWGKDWAGGNVQAVILKTESAPYPVGNLAWNWSTPIYSYRTMHALLMVVRNAFITGTGVPAPTQP